MKIHGEVTLMAVDFEIHAIIERGLGPVLGLDVFDRDGDGQNFVNIKLATHPENKMHVLHKVIEFVQENEDETFVNIVKKIESNFTIVLGGK